MNNFYLFGKGELAIYCAEKYLSKYPHKNLKIIPTLPEPDWTESLTTWAKNNQVELISFSEIKESSLGENPIGMSIYYDKIFKKQVIDKFIRLCNIHNGPLPKYRGMNPVNWALKNNELKHGITLHLIDEGIDTGEILDQETFSINQEMEVKDVYELCLKKGRVLIDNNLLELDKISSKPQDHSKSLYYSMLDYENLGDRKDFTRN
jgi:methionyl-tRNA formyltransferase